MINKKLSLVAAAVAVGLTVAACSSPAGSDGASKSGGGGGDAAESAAKELGINLADCPTDPTKKFGKDAVVAGRALKK